MTAQAPDTTERRLIEIPVHPFLFGGYAVLFLWAQNVEKVHPGDVVMPLLSVLGGTAFVFGVAWLLLRSAWKAAVATTLVSFLFFSFGHVVGSSVIHTQEAAVASPHMAQWLAVWAGLAVAGLVAVAVVRHEGRRLAFILNAVLLVLVLVAGLTIGVGTVQARGELALAGAEDLVGGSSEPGAPAQGRDIYFILLDRYPDQATLRDKYQHDNSGFLEALEERGFYVASDSRAPYPKTPHSIQTTLNMEYVEDLPEDSGNWRLVFDKLMNPTTARFLKEQGYRYVFMGSRNHSLRRDPSADINVWWDPGTGPAVTEFGQVLYNSTVLAAIAERYDVSLLDPRWQEYQRARFQFQELRKIPRIPEPTYTFAHILIPHPPYVFDGDCDFLNERRLSELSMDEAFLGTIDCSGKKTLELLDELLAGPPEEHPIIVIQSDEGPGPVGWNPSTREKYDWTQAPQEVLEEKFGILNAYYLPGVEDHGLYPSISPVNTFRVIFNHYFDAGLPLLPDRSYVFYNEAEPYRFIDVTERVR